MYTFIILAIIIAVLIITFFAIKISSEKKAKQTYTPPVAAEKTVLPAIEETKLPAKSQNRLHFCKNCGTANSDQANCCSNCGSKL
jgi:hypothetical protein